MTDLFDDPAIEQVPKKRNRKAKVDAPATKVKPEYDPDADRELTRPEIERIYQEKERGYSPAQIAVSNRLPIKRVELALGIDMHWYKRILERLALIEKYGQETFDFAGMEYRHRQNDLTNESEIAGVPIADAERMWKLQFVPDRPSDLHETANEPDRAALKLKRLKEERRKAFSYWLRKLNCSRDIAELVRRTAAGESFPELGDTYGHSRTNPDSIFDALFGETDDEEETIGSDPDHYLPQELIDQCNKSIMDWLGTKSLAFADAVRRNLWRYHALEKRKADPIVTSEPRERQYQGDRMRRYLADADD